MRMSEQRILGFDVRPIQRLAHPESVFFWWGRTPTPIVWSPSYSRNAVYCFGDRAELFLRRIERVAALSNKPYLEQELPKSSRATRNRGKIESGFRDNATVAVYDLSGVFADKAVKLQKLSKTLVYKRPSSIATLIQSFNAFRKDVRAAYNSSYNATRRVPVLAFLVLGEADLELLKANEELLHELEDIFLNAPKERLYLFIGTDKASNLSARLVASADQAMFIGEDNEKLAEAFYKVAPTDKVTHRVPCGLIWDRAHENTLSVFAEPNADLQDWVKAETAEVKRQDEEWLSVLAQLEEERG